MRSPSLKLVKLSLFGVMALSIAASASAAEPAYGQCYARFNEHRRELAKQSLLVDPLGSLGIELGGAVLGATLGEFSTFDLTLFAVDLTGGLGGLVLGGGTIAIAGTYFETRSIVRWIQTENTMRLIREAYAGSGKRLARLSLRLKLDESEVAQKIVAWTENGSLCDGSLKKRAPKNNRLKNLLLTPGELRKALITP